MYILSVIWPPIGRLIKIIQQETRKDLHLPHLLHLALFKALISDCTKIPAGASSDESDCRLYLTRHRLALRKVVPVYALFLYIMDILFFGDWAEKTYEFLSFMCYLYNLQ